MQILYSAENLLLVHIPGPLYETEETLSVKGKRVGTQCSDRVLIVRVLDQRHPRSEAPQIQGTPQSFKSRNSRGGEWGIAQWSSACLACMTP